MKLTKMHFFKLKKAMSIQKMSYKWGFSGIKSVRITHILVNTNFYIVYHIILKMIEIAKKLKILERHSSTYDSGIVICLWPSFLYSVKHINILLYQNCGEVAHMPLKSR